MKKRLIKRTRKTTTPKASYPTEEEFQGNRRDFLARFGATVLGAGGLAASLAACGGDRAVGAKKPEPDAGHMMGVAPPPDARADRKVLKKDGYGGPAGAMPSPDAKVDKKEMGMLGDAPAPDAKIEKKDHGASPGFAPPPDAKIDKKKDFGMAGGAPAPDAAGDEKKP